jgi:hypothetical protein
MPSAARKLHRHPDHLQEIQGLELNAGRFTQEARKSAEGRDSGGLKSINVLGGSYKFTDNFTASLYTADNEDVMKKHYLGLNYVFPIASDQSLTLDFNGYKTDIDNKRRCRAERRLQHHLEPGGHLRLRPALVHPGAPAQHRQHRLQLRRLPERRWRG